MDLPAHEFKLVLLSADGGHGITHERYIAPIFCRKRRSYNNWINVDAIKNHAGRKTFVSKREADNTRFAGAHGRHCIKEVCNAAKPLVDGPYQIGGLRLTMTD